MDKTRCKFYVQSVTKHGYSADGQPKTSSIEVKLSAVYAPNDKSANHEFWTASPSGKLEISINNPACFAFFKEGEEMYLDIIKIQK